MKITEFGSLNFMKIGLDMGSTLLCSTDPKRYLEAELYIQHIFYSEPDSLHANFELARLYRKMRKFKEREKILFEIYELKPEDIPTLMALADVFMRFKKYRIAIKLLENALGYRKTDLITISKLIRLHSIICNNVTVKLYLNSGLEILKHDPNHKHAERFKRLFIELDEEVTMIEFNNVGYFTKQDGQEFVESSTDRYSLTEETTANYRVISGDKVYFATYKKDELIFVDFVEPFFENIDHLEQLK